MSRSKSKMRPLSAILIVDSTTQEKTSAALPNEWSKQADKTRGLDIINEAQNYWYRMTSFRRRRQRCKDYTYGKQWGDVVCIDGKMMTEEEYITRQGRTPLKNNLIRRLITQIIGVFRNQAKEPICTARDREEQRLGETMTVLLQYNMQVNSMTELLARSLEEFLISGLIVHSKRFKVRDGKADCWTEYVNPNNIIIDTNMKDFRAWDLSFIGEIHDLSRDELVAQFARTPEDLDTLTNIYALQNDQRQFSAWLADEFGERAKIDPSFFAPLVSGIYRVFEIWRKESKPRYRVFDPLKGEVYKIEEADYAIMVEAENLRRIEEASLMGYELSDTPLLRSEWFIDTVWWYYYITPFGDILREGESPYEHKSYPYVIKPYPFIDGEIHSLTANIIDQQRYINRLIILYDWILSSSAKGVLMFPEEALPSGMSLEDIADEWSRFNGVITIKAKPGTPLPQQISNNSTNIGINELLGMQMRLFEDISGVHGALQGKPGNSGMSAALYAQQVQQSSTNLIDILDSFSSFIVEGAMKDVKNIQQFYNTDRIRYIAGRKAKLINSHPEEVKDIDFDLSISEGTNTPVFRQLANDFLMQIWSAGQITLEQLLEHGDFPFADDLLQSVRAQQEEQKEQQNQALLMQAMGLGQKPTAEEGGQNAQT